MSLDMQLDAFLDKHPDIEIFEVLLHDINGVQRGKWLPVDKIHKLFEGGFKMPLSTCSLDCWGRDLESLVSETGDRDGICVPDISTISVVPWATRPTAQIVVSMTEEDTGAPYMGDVRAVLVNIVDRFKALGLTPVVASEMEFHLTTLEEDKFGRPKHSQTALDGSPAIGGQTYGIDTMRQTAPLMDAIIDAAQQQNLPVDTLITEFGPSQFEINLYHQDCAVRACDQGSMLKRAIRSVAMQQEKRATFMAKPYADEVGNGMHIHFSLVDEQGNNVFDNGTAEGSDLLRHAVAGCLQNMADSMAIFAPNINSYRRLVPGCYAPLAPNWGYENRTTALRIPGGDRRAMRIEHRVAGADANPYLTVAAMLAGALSGIERKLQAPAPVVGDAGDITPVLPHFWNDAINTFEQSDFIEEYLGSVLKSNYAECKRQEKYEFDRRVTLLEYDAYL
ncbi:glutamine synthetase family protein [Porticoccaceae bacterium]|nr:glutamine synthetase family protein [Porticoccaceae bacterium]MDB2663529.1 glutamine synthetase family protein [Porticoccaceae bacterium]MDC0494761.1 glutamine synthetase family protein [bacterium]